MYCGYGRERIRGAPVLVTGRASGEIREFSLGDYVGEDVVVVCFYPGDFNPYGARDRWLQDVDLLTLQRNVTVLGIAPDTAYSHREFASEYNVEFPLLADIDGSVADAYDVADVDLDGHTGLPSRAVFVVDDRGIVQDTWIAEDRSHTPDIDDIRAVIGTVKSDDSAIDRYADGFDYYQYGQEEFAIAAFDSADWGLAIEAFSEASRYFENAASGFGSAKWFAENANLVAEFRIAKDTTDHYVRASRWYREAAEYYQDGHTSHAEDCRTDAEYQHQRAHAADELPAPGKLSTLADGDGAEAQA